MIINTNTLMKYLDYIRDRTVPFRMTSNDIWGKYAIVKEKRYELQTMKIEVEWTDNDKVEDVIEKFKSKMIVEENKPLIGIEDPSTVVCYQLCDWSWLPIWESDEYAYICGFNVGNEKHYKAWLVKYAYYLIENTTPKINPEVHASHCCKIHGCKYGKKDCPVVTGKVKQLHLCEYCYEDLEDEDYIIRQFNNLKKIKKLKKELEESSEV